MLKIDLNRFRKVQANKKENDMLKVSLSQDQLRDLEIFNLILETDGWNDELDCEERLSMGEEVNPEGSRSIPNDFAKLLAQFHAPLNMISLQISEKRGSDKIRLHFFFDNKPERVLEWLSSSRPALSMDSYPELLKKAGGCCEMILLEIAYDEMYEIKLSKPKKPLEPQY